MRDIGVMVVVMVVMDRRTIVVLFSVSKRLLGAVSVVWNVLLIFKIAMMALVSKRVVVFAVKTTMMVGAVIEVMSIVVLVVMMTMLSFTAAVMALQIAIMVRQIIRVMQLVVLLVQAFNVMIVNNVLVVGFMGLMRDIVDNSVVVVRGHTSHLLEVRSTMKHSLVSLVMRDRLLRSS